MGRIAIIALFYYLNIISASNPRYFYIFWKVCSNVNFESWKHLKIIYGWFLKNVWNHKSYWLAIFTVGDLQVQMRWFQRHWIKIFQSYLTKFISQFLDHYSELGWIYKWLHRTGFQNKEKSLFESAQRS